MTGKNSGNEKGNPDINLSILKEIENECKKLKEQYGDIKDKTKLLFDLAILIIVIGFIIILIGFLGDLFGFYNADNIVIISGVIVEFFSGTLIVLYKLTSNKLESVNKALEKRWFLKIILKEINESPHKYKCETYFKTIIKLIEGFLK